MSEHSGWYEDATDNQLERWQSIAEAWTDDWRGMVGYLLDHTDIESRTEAMLFHIMMSANMWASTTGRLNERQKEMWPRLEEHLDRLDEEFDDGEEWRD